MHRLETLRQFPFVDVVVSGEADTIVVDLIRGLLEGRVPSAPGVYVRGTVSSGLLPQPLGNAALVHDLDTLPVPDYAAYFEQLVSRDAEHSVEPCILFESARGCWWGMKAHCTFCGLNGTSMAFRSKSTARVLSELETLHQRHPECMIIVVDNILDHKYFHDLIPELGRRPDRYRLFYEVKSNLTKPQLLALRQAEST